MELMKDTFKRDMEEVAAEAAAAASTERSNIAMELAEGAERISQLGSNIHDLQVIDGYKKMMILPHLLSSLKAPSPVWSHETG